MKKFLYLLLLYFTLSINSYAQEFSNPTKRAILIKNTSSFNVGDTLKIFGVKTSDYGSKQFLIKDIYGTRYLKENKVRLLDDDHSFWENVWFTNRAADITESGKDVNERAILSEEAYDYFQNAVQSDIVFENELLYDYIYQIILDIHPQPIIKANRSYFKVLIIKSTDAESFTFDNGLVVITTGLLANLNSKKDLVELLAMHVAHTVLEHNLINLKQEIKAERRAAVFSGIAAATTAVAGAYAAIEHDIYIDPYLPADIGLATYFISKSLMESAGASYNQSQIMNAKKITSQFLAEHEDLTWHNELEFDAYMAPATSFTAWQEYYMKNYSQSLYYTEKLHQKQLAIEDNYLLFSKLLRNTSNSEASNLLALQYLTIAQDMSKNLLIDLDKEAALIYLRLDDKENAKIALNNYKKGLELLSEKGIPIEKEMNNINQIVYYHKLDLDQIEN